MKLLLTSAGLINDSLRNALKELVGNDIKTVYIPTASNVEDDDKSWLVDDMQEFAKLGYL